MSPFFIQHCLENKNISIENLGQCFLTENSCRVLVTDVSLLLLLPDELVFLNYSCWEMVEDAEQYVKVLGRPLHVFAGSLIPFSKVHVFSLTAFHLEKGVPK